MKKSQLRQIIREEIRKLNEYSQNLINLHFSRDKNDIKKIRNRLKKQAGWSDSDIDYMLKKLRKDFDYKGPEIYDPKYYDKADSKYQKFDDLHAPKDVKDARKKEQKRKETENRLTKKQYWKELKDIISGHEHDDHSIFYDLAENLYLSNPKVVEYLERVYGKKRKQDAIEKITDDLEMFAK